jgi:tRNA(Ile)-lysidine synthase
VKAVAGSGLGAHLAPWRERVLGLDDLEGRVVVACSGGPDSLALLALAVDRGLDATAVYVDHGLRPDSAADGAVVAAHADVLGAASATTTVAVAPGSNLEARARSARYAALESMRAALGASDVLVGHTADDQAETVLLNFVRGSGSAGLAGMAVRRGTVVRPLLGLRRRDTAQLCAECGFTPVHDPTNLDPALRRVWARTEALPFLNEGAARDLVPILARQADLLREESDYLDAAAAAVWPDDRCSARRLAALDAVLARRAVRRWLGAPPVSQAEVERVLAVARGERRATEVSGGRRVSRTGGLLSVVTE